MKVWYLLLFFLLIRLNVFPQQAIHPNIIFIVVDDLNDYVGFLNGHPQTSTPNMDALAAESIVFQNAYCSSPVCAPSRASFMSGKYPAYTGVYNNVEYEVPFRANFNAEKNNEEVFPLPAHFKESGNYFTYSIGKVFHKDNDDYDALSSNNCYRELSWNKSSATYDGEALTEFLDGNNDGFDDMPWGIVPEDLKELMQDEKAADLASEFIKDVAEGKNITCGKSFFLAVGINKPHAMHAVPSTYFLPYYLHDFFSEPFQIPYLHPADTFPANGVIMPPQPEIAWSDFEQLPLDGVARVLVKTIYTDFIDFPYSLASLPEINASLSDSERISILQESKRANMVMAYLASVKYADEQIGKIIQTLKSYPEIDENTIVVLFSDNGFSLGEKNHWEKDALWQTDVRVPLIIRDACFEHKNIYSAVSLVDIYPTLCSISGIEEPHFSDGSRYLDGMNLTPLFNATDTADHTVLSCIKTLSDNGSCFPQYAIINNQFHLIEYAQGDININPECLPDTTLLERELYQVGIKKEIDPNLWNNLAYDSAYSETITEMLRYLPMHDLFLYAPTVSDDLQMPCFDFISTQDQIVLYPNPANYQLNIYSKTALQNAVFIFQSIDGKTLSKEVFSGQENYFSLPTGQIPAGVYLLQCVSDNMQFAEKFCKQ